MNTFLKHSLWLTAMLLASFFTEAQTKTSPQTAYNDDANNTYYRVHNEAAGRTENIQTEYRGKTYKIEWLNEKMTSLSVDGEKIPEADWNKYSDATRHIHEGIKEQVKRNNEQSKRNAEQSIRNAEQAKRNEEQAKKNAEQDIRNAEQVKKNEEQSKKNAEQSVRNAEQSKRDEEQAARNQLQSKKNAEQAERNQLQAKKNEEQARANAQVIKDITNDLVNDKIIADTASLHEFSFNAESMTVNGVKQPQAVFEKYKSKYNKVYNGNFTYSRDGIIQGR